MVPEEPVLVPSFEVIPVIPLLNDVDVLISGSLKGVAKSGKGSPKISVAVSSPFSAKVKGAAKSAIGSPKISGKKVFIPSVVVEVEEDSIVSDVDIPDVLGSPK